jgi:hypothetical protein
VGSQTYPVADSQHFVLAVGDAIPNVLAEAGVEIVERRPMFVLVRASQLLARKLRRESGPFVTVLQGDRAARAALGLFENVPNRISD